jgi:hypothetical protein
MLSYIFEKYVNLLGRFLLYLYSAQKQNASCIKFIFSFHSDGNGYSNNWSSGKKTDMDLEHKKTPTNSVYNTAHIFHLSTILNFATLWQS